MGKCIRLLGILGLLQGGLGSGDTGPAWKSWLGALVGYMKLISLSPVSPNNSGWVLKPQLLPTFSWVFWSASAATRVIFHAFWCCHWWNEGHVTGFDLGYVLMLIEYSIYCNSREWYSHHQLKGHQFHFLFNMQLESGKRWKTVGLENISNSDLPTSSGTWSKSLDPLNLASLIIKGRAIEEDLNSYKAIFSFIILFLYTLYLQSHETLYERSNWPSLLP